MRTISWFLSFSCCGLKRALICVLILLGINVSNAQVQWAKQMGGSDGDIGSCSSADLFGNIYTTGTFSSTAGFGTYNLTSKGKGDIFITRANASNGDVDWVKQFGGLNEDNGYSIVCDPAGNIYCTGRFSGMVVFGTSTLTSNGANDAFILKLDATGSIIWVKKVGGTGFDGGLAITSDTAGNIYTSGYFQGTAGFGSFTVNPTGTNFNVFLAKTDGLSGNILWAKAYGSAGYTYGTSVSCDIVGDVYLTGYFESDVVFGTYTVSSVQYQDIFISKHNAATGNVAWATSMGGMGNDNGDGITVNADGYVYSTGKFEQDCAFGTTTLTSSGSADIYICKTDAATGSLVSVKQLGDVGYEQANAITHDVSGNLFITGQFNGIVNFGNYSLSSAGNADVFIVKMDPGINNVLWATAMGGTAVDSGYNITTDSSSGVYCTGSFQANADFLNYSFSAKGSTDIFVLKLDGATVGIRENAALFNNIQAMPVPCNDELTVLINKNTVSPYKLTLSDLFGNILLRINSRNGVQILNVAVLPAGVYFLTVMEETGACVVKKIVKE
jgi:hypothetical protein